MNSDVALMHCFLGFWKNKTFSNHVFILLKSFEKRLLVIRMRIYFDLCDSRDWSLRWWRDPTRFCKTINRKEKKLNDTGACVHYFNIYM